MRLLPPFAFGIVFLAPIIKYYELLDGRSIRWNGLVAVTDPLPGVAVFLQFFFTRMKWFSWSHMWFPLYLLIISALLLPVLRAMGRTRGDAVAGSPRWWAISHWCCCSQLRSWCGRYSRSTFPICSGTGQVSRSI